MKHACGVVYVGPWINDRPAGSKCYIVLVGNYRCYLVTFLLFSLTTLGI